ncbi:hypothetical protein DL240_00160 [Lujinxingia litoralis]|uniref:Uncharacterized protein n=1 Tax=Lujinxingia litoralis TaxID=2211119 RepID=A0A328C9N4_9DELT|nr:hypothetical protein DL240_00160 [Lujinxingia litoralis]
MALIAAVLVLHRNPIAVDADEQLSAGVEVTREARADVLVVLDYEVIRQSGPSFSERDFSAAWINLVEQEFGPVAIATPQTLAASTLDESRVIILTSSVTADLPSSTLEAVRRRAREGSLVIVERPRGELRAQFSANGRAGVRRAQRLTHADGLSDPFLSQLRQTPMATDFIGSTSPREGASTLLSIDGAPVIYALPVGQGHVITVDFDLGEQLVSLQQGRPDENYRLRGDHGQRPPRTSDLVADEKLPGAEVPYADLLERYIAHGVIARYAPLPAFWAYPGDALGAVVFLHEDARLGDGGAWMLDYENSQRANSTLLSSIDSGLTKEGAESIHKRGGEVGLLWRYPHPHTATYAPDGFGAFQPLKRPLTIEEQLNQMRDLLPINYIRTTRSIDGTWAPTWSAPLAALAEANIRIDASYAVPGHSGFAFGTGLPFLALSDEGIPLGLRELPIIVPPHRLQGPDFATLLETSAGGHHQTITVAIDPGAFADYPNVDDFEEWLSMFESIESHQHTVMNALRLDAFQRSRRAGSIRSRLLRNTELPAHTRESADRARTGTIMRLTIEAKERNMSVVIPATIGDRSFLGARSGTRRVGGELMSSEVETFEASLIGLQLRRVPLSQGFNNFEFYYD